VVHIHKKGLVIMKRACSLVLLSCTALALTASLAACSDDPKTEAAKLDQKLLGKGDKADPALTAALEDQIMVDPSLTGQSNQHAVRPADEPGSSPIPPAMGEAPATDIPGRKTVTLGQLAAAQATGSKSSATYAGGAKPVAAAGVAQSSFTGCGLDVDYAMGWANRLPAAMPLHPGARVEEAAGSDKAGCRLRAVTYTTAASMQDMIAYYQGKARKAGFSAEHKNEDGNDVIGGTRKDGAAYYVILTPRPNGGTTADFVTNAGV
jgi:hypothetical protein